MNCIMCRPFAWIRGRLPRRCIADRPEVQRKFSSWRYAQGNDRKIFESDPEREVVEATMKLQVSDPEAAFPQFLALAERGSVWSMLCLGWQCQRGVGVTANTAEAARWYRLAFEGGCQRALFYLGNMYWLQGDFDECEKTLEASVAEHWAPAMYVMAIVKLRQPKTRVRVQAARILLEEASLLGDVGAQWALGRMMVRGRFGLRWIPRGFRLGLDACKKTLALMDADTPTASPPSSAIIVGVTEP